MSHNRHNHKENRNIILRKDDKMIIILRKRDLP